MRFDLARMHGAPFFNEAKDLGGLLASGGVPGAAKGRTRVHQLVLRPRQESIVHKEAFLDREFRIGPLEITHPVVLHPVSQGKVLRARRCAYEIGL